MSDHPSNLNLPPPGAKPDPLAAALARLEPAPARLDRDRLMYQAGAESRRWVVRLWQATAGFLAAVGFWAGAQVYLRPPVVVERVVYVEKESAKAEPQNDSQLAPAPTPKPAPEAPPPAAAVPEDLPASHQPPAYHLAEPAGDMATYYQLRNDVLTGGLGLLPDPGRQRR